jgi:hypothetical protein
VNYEASNVVQTNFFKTSLKGIDMSRSTFIYPIVSNQLTELKGLIVNSNQAVDLVTLLGVKVKG